MMILLFMPKRNKTGADYKGWRSGSRKGTYSNGRGAARIGGCQTLRAYLAAPLHLPIWGRDGGQARWVYARLRQRQREHARA